MISTCVHCKKQFEWEKDTLVDVCIHVVICCHCNRQVWFTLTGVSLPHTKSKPLQVAKKWVVRIGSDLYLVHRGLVESDQLKAGCFLSRKAATSEVDAHAYAYQGALDNIFIYQVNE